MRRREQSQLQEQLAAAWTMLQTATGSELVPGNGPTLEGHKGHNGNTVLMGAKKRKNGISVGGQASSKPFEAAIRTKPEPPQIRPQKAQLQLQSQVTLRKVGSFSPHPLLSTSGEPGDAPRIRPCNDGVAKDLLGIREEPEDEADLIIGLDFGTSTVKAVIRDRFRSQAFAVPFTSSSDNPYLLPSRVYKSGDHYSLDSGGLAKRDIKLSLLSCQSGSPVNEFNDACAFLALVIRHCRGWLFDAHATLYRGVKIYWSLNLGLPAASYEKNDTVQLFRRLAWAAANLAGQSGAEATYGNCDEFRQLSRTALAEHLNSDASDTGFEFEFENVDVVPEIAAQIYGYVTSSKWDWAERPMMMLVDIGAGTVDAAFFSFTKYVEGKRRFAFFASAVQPNGAINLHRERIGWLHDAARASQEKGEIVDYLNAIKYPTDWTAPLPERVHQYIPGYDIVCEAGVRNVDESFYGSRYRTQVATCCGDARRAGIPDVQLQDVPCFLTGGGSRLGLYSSIVDDITANNTNITLQRMTLTRMSEDMECPGLRDTDFDRLSVAYGLSHNGADGEPLGTLIRTMDVNRPAEPPSVNRRVNYVDKDMV